MDQTHPKNHSTQPSSTVVKTNQFNQSVLTEKNILELIYQDKWDNIKSCLIDDKNIVEKYNKIIIDNKDKLDTLEYKEVDVDRDNFDQQNRGNWYMPDEYKNLDIEKYVLDLANTSEEKQRVEQELHLFKSHAMIDVLKFLKYMVDSLRKNNIVWGVGRGSSVASYVLYLIGVHKVNSIKYNLDPTEFLR